ncbi:MAG: PEP-CTERM sorting domain-containing protein, partial [Planctomycetota bacterium]
TCRCATSTWTLNVVGRGADGAAPAAFGNQGATGRGVIGLGPHRRTRQRIKDRIMNRTTSIRSFISQSRLHAVIAGLAVAATATIAAAPATADLVAGQPIMTPGNNMSVTIEFTGSEAAANGQFYFLGVGDANSVYEWAPDSDDRDLGTFLFDNKKNKAGDALTLEGVFHEGDVLHFAYDIPKGRYENQFRSDTVDRSHFAFDLDSGELGIEDLRESHKWYDGDYDDASFRVSFNPSVPGPATAGLFMIGATWMGVRRRRNRVV